MTGIHVPASANTWQTPSMIRAIENIYCQDTSRRNLRAPIRTKGPNQRQFGELCMSVNFQAIRLPSTVKDGFAPEENSCLLCQ